MSTKEQSDIARRAAAIEHEFETRTERLAKKMRNEFDTDDALTVTNNAFHLTIRQNWSDPAWRVENSQRMGPTALYKAALAAFGRNLDGTPSIDSHPDAIEAEPNPSALKDPSSMEEARKGEPKLPSVFPFQGPPQTAPQPVPVMPMPAPPIPPPGMPPPPQPQMPV